MSALSTAEQVRANADGGQVELAACDFLDRHGRVTDNRKRYVIVRLTFIDGERMLVKREVMEREMLHFRFRLRPARDDA